MRKVKRTFMIGEAARLLYETVPNYFRDGVLVPSEIGYRRIIDFICASHPTGEDFLDKAFREDPVHISIMRGPDIKVIIPINPRATFRWVDATQVGIEIPADIPFMITVAHCYTKTTFTIVSALKPYRPGHPDPNINSHSECFAFTNEKLDVEGSGPMAFDGVKA